MDSNYYTKLAQIESGGDPNAKNPNSSASGLFQFTKATAEQYGLKNPNDPVEARAAVEKFTQDNFKTLQSKLGRDPTQGELYLAHQQGAGGALKLLQNKDKKAIEVVGSDQVLNNGGDENMTAADFAAKWTGKFGDAPSGNDTLVGGEGNDTLAQPTYAKIITLPDGGQIGLNGTETPVQLLQLKAKIAEKYGTSLNVDRDTGAHPAVRAFVGSVYDKADKLASLQKYYPDAIEYGEDNYVFTNPDTGKITLYNPTGFFPDIGDVASVTKEAFQAVGSTFGAAGGALLGGLKTGAQTGGVGLPYGAYTGGIAGAGFGSSVTGSAFDMLLNKFGLTTDTRTYQEKALDFAGETVVGAAGEGFGMAVSAGTRATKGFVSQKVKSALGGGSLKSQELLKTFDEFGIKPAASLVSDSSNVSILENYLQQNPFAADIMIKSADDVVNGVKTSVDDVISQIGQAKTKQGAGAAIRESAVNAAERFNFKQEKIYEEAFNLIGARTPVQVPSISALRKEISSEISDAPNSLKPILGQALKKLDNIAADSRNGGIPFETLRQIRTAIGRDLASPQLSGSTGSQNEALKRIYGALTEDLSNAAASSGGEAAKKLKTADRYTRQFMNNSKDFLQKIANFDADEKAFSFAMSASKDGGTSLSRLRNNFKPEEWDVISASVLDKLGDASAGMQGAAGDTFSINSFLTNWNKLAPEAKDALLGGKRYAPQKEALEKLTRIMESVKDVSRFQNTSNTGGSVQTYMLISSLLGGVGGLATGSGAGVGAVIGTGGVALSSRQAAKLLTNPKFVDWLAEPAEKAAAKEGYSFASHLARLAFIAETQPEIADEIDLYAKSLKSQVEK